MQAMMGQGFGGFNPMQRPNLSYGGKGGSGFNPMMGNNMNFMQQMLGVGNGSSRQELLHWAFKGRNAIAYVNTIFRISQTWDDLIDRDRVPTPDEINSLMWDALFTLGENPFYISFQHQLCAVQKSAALDWFAANELEVIGARQKNRLDHKRQQMALIAFVATLLYGPKWGAEVATAVRRHTHDEEFEDYIGGLDNG